MDHTEYADAILKGVCFKTPGLDPLCWSQPTSTLMLEIKHKGHDTSTCNDTWWD